ncbi:MAG: hypothetical protein Q7R43_02625 [Candidatus Daviesbacteria bacterium]|nr:hypothetical protein [Candidatus Daviesbacteria bacterium]
MVLLEHSEMRGLAEANALKAANAFSNLPELAKMLGFSSLKDFQRYLDGKRVLDLGSGYNGLAVGVILAGLDTKVVSVNPHFKDPFFGIHQKGTIEYTRRIYYPLVSPKALEEARVESLCHTHSAFAHDLPFGEEFDLVIDNLAVLAYIKEETAPVLKDSLTEELRVLIPGGLIRAHTLGAVLRPQSWRVELLREMGLNYRVLDPSLLEITKC